MIEKPMLAGTLKDLKTLKYPVLCTPKIDGIRCLKVDGKAVTRTFKPFPNKYVRNCIERVALDGFDGEVIVKGKQFNEVSSLVMSQDGKPDFTYLVFDYCIEPKEYYINRMERLSKLSVKSNIEYLLPIFINDESELLRYETNCLTMGYEGVMLRSIYSPYKYGRSTINEGWLLKLKRFSDSEAVILDVVEKMSNQNEAEEDVFGHTKRSSALSGQVPAGTLGGFKVKDLKSGVEFGVGSGFNDTIRAEVWKHKESYVGKIIKYKSQKSGEKDAPRFPVFLGFRDKKDIIF